MDAKPWRQRAREEEELLEQLRTQVSAAAKRRAAALAEGVAELGTVAAVAKDLGKPWTTIAQAIKKHGPAGTGTGTTE
ncbi:hypothetical protein ACIQ6Y_15390 [Streptomyces sp. NPDC096205]|uniref:hypothetical protein n=1 Tax=Streptomyces sp. NPDC096205 TaxID=3366081 RepID=UPI0038012C26